MKTHEVPANFRVYFKKFRERYTQERKDSLEEIAKKQKELDSLYSTINDSKEDYEKDCGITLNSYKEFIENKYINGEFLRTIKGIVINKENDFKLIGTKYDLYRVGELQKQIYDLNKVVEKDNKLINIKLKEYNALLRLYYTKVQELMILKGYGYVFPKDMGYIVINRCVIENGRKMLDYAATKKNKEKLIAEGRIPYNKKDAEYYKNHGLEYKGESFAVYRHDKDCYEIPLIHCILPNSRGFSFTPSDYRGAKIRGKSNEDLLVECNNDTKEILKLDVGIMTKLILCNKVDKSLYLKFVRNETQKPYSTTAVNRKG